MLDGEDALLRRGERDDVVRPAPVVQGGDGRTQLLGARVPRCSRAALDAAARAASGSSASSSPTDTDSQSLDESMSSVVNS